MPLTFPSHAAAILPLTHRRLAFLPPTALVVGAGAPDLGYLLRIGGSHEWTGLWKVTVLGLMAWLWVEVLLLPLLRRMLPRERPAIAERLMTRGLPRGWREGAGGLLALLLGAMTHLLWDGLTHDGLWPAQVLYPEVELAGGMTLARVLQHASTVLGGAAAIGVWWHRAPREGRLLPVRASRVWSLLVLLVLAAAMSLQAFRELRWMHPSTTLEVWLWNAVWSSARGGAVALTLLAIIDRFVASSLWRGGSRTGTEEGAVRPEADGSS